VANRDLLADLSDEHWPTIRVTSAATAEMRHPVSTTVTAAWV